MSAARRDLHEINRRSWNAVTAAHNSHKVDQAEFLRDGGHTLFDEELELLGPLRGAHVAHLQCNCGQDTLSLVLRGATVVGVDISDDAIAFARELSRASGLPASFVRADVFDFLAQTTRHGTFDVVFVSYGAIGWLSDLPGWARGVRSLLRPGGRLVLVEFHPLVWCFDRDGRLVAPYFGDGPIREPEGVSDYVGRSGASLAPMGFAPGDAQFANACPSVGFQWTVAELVQAVLDAGLVLESLREYPHVNGCRLLDGMRELPGRRLALPPELPSMPLMLGLAARRPAPSR